MLPVLIQHYLQTELRKVQRKHVDMTTRRKTYRYTANNIISGRAIQSNSCSRCRLETEIKELISLFFRKVFCNGKRALWEQTKRIISSLYSDFVLSAEEIVFPDRYLLSELELPRIILRLQQMAGVEFNLSFLLSLPYFQAKSKPLCYQFLAKYLT